MKNMMTGSPKLVRTTERKSAMPNAGIIRTTSSEVAANGIASVTQRVTANAMIARHALPLTVSGIRLPARSSGGGVGSA